MPQFGPKPDNRAALQNRAKADIEIQGITAFLANGIQSRQLAALWHPATLAALATLIYDGRPVSAIFTKFAGAAVVRIAVARHKRIP